MNCATKNPKDPTSIMMNALLDTGANCNVISNRFSSILNLEVHSKRRIRFANTGNSQEASICSISFQIEHSDLILKFDAEFYCCDIVEDIILGNPFLKKTGLVYLCLVDSADNPFLSQVNVLEELVTDIDGECEELEPSQEKAYDEDTENPWNCFASSLGIQSIESLFAVIVYYALHTTYPIGDFCKRSAQVLELMLKGAEYSYSKSAIPFMKRHFHENAPFKELNLAVEVITNNINMIWDISNIGVAKFRDMTVDFDMEAFKRSHKKQNVQSLNEPMSQYLENFLTRLRSRNMLRKVPLEEMADRITVSTGYLIPKHVLGKFRFIVDLLKSGVNGATRPISYPAPDLHEHLDFSAGHDVVSTADGCDFYFQMPVAPECRHLFTIVTKFGYDEFCTLPQGSKNACQHVAQVVGETLMAEGLSHEHKCYFDDFHNRANFGEGNMKFFDALLRLVEFHIYGLRYNIKFDIQKANLCFGTVDLLGFTIDKQGKRISASRVDALRNLRKPKSRNDVEKLLGCFVFVAKWIQKFAEFTAPLYALLHKGVRFEASWTTVHEEALSALRRCVETAPILVVLNYKNMVYLRTDASLLAIAAVVYQFVEDKELPACYGSKKLTTSQKNWPIVQTEFFALIFFIRKWKSMLQGAEVTIEIDARNLLWARNSSNEMVRRWSYEVDSYINVVKVVHIPGSSNEPVDSMSRFVDEDDLCSKLSVFAMSLSPDEEFSVSVLMQEENSLHEGHCCNFELLSTIEEIDALTDQEKSE